MNTKLESLIDAPTPVAEKSLADMVASLRKELHGSPWINDRIANAVEAEVLRRERVQELREGLDALQIEPVMVPWLTSITKTMTGSHYEETNMPCGKPAIEGRP